VGVARRRRRRSLEEAANCGAAGRGGSDAYAAIGTT
jgi:hypothetical protein